jgi:hypothetical protein
LQRLKEKTGSATKSNWPGTLSTPARGPRAKGAVAVKLPPKLADMNWSDHFPLRRVKALDT